ncbi:MAG: hypothetical protein ACWGMZ_02290 [Thermoguttaceae bacterium]
MMNEHENELKRALVENGRFDAERAKQLSEAAVSHYVNGLKKTERVLWIYLIVCVTIMAFSCDIFLFATSNKMMIGSGIMFLVALETTILMKLWYWIVNTKLTLQKEIRQWQVQRSLPEPAANAPTWLGEMSFGRTGLSTWERRAWLIGMIVVAEASAFLALRLSCHVWPHRMARFENAPVTVEAPRIGAPVFYTIYIRMDKGVCKVSRVTPEDKQSDLFSMGKGFVNNGTLPPGDSLRLDPQGNKGEYWVRFE